MTREGFRRLALSMPEASESAHMGHPDFRVRGKILATLSYPDENWGMVKLTPEQQDAFASRSPPHGATWRHGSSRKASPAARCSPHSRHEAFGPRHVRVVLLLQRR